MNDRDTPIVDMLTVRGDLYLVMSLLPADERVAKVQNVVVWTRAFHGWADFENSKKTTRTFRRACNSVIHAKERLPYRAPARDSIKNVRRVDTNRITVRATKQGKTTRAQIDIIPFIRIAYELTKSFEKDRYAD